MESVNIPLIPQWNLISGCCSSPDDGLLYIGHKAICYISKIDDINAPQIQILQTNIKMYCIDSDPDWSETKYFAVLTADNLLQIWDLEEGKVKMGHKAHYKTSQEDEEHSGKVQLCFLKNRSILSIDSSCLVQYCPSSNTYSKEKRIILARHEVSTIKGSPYDEKIVAMGTTKGLVLIIDIKEKNILHTLRGHDTKITSLSWMKFETTIPVTGRKLNTSKIGLRTAEDDDLFDIYDYDYLENEFGAPNNLQLQESIDASMETPQKAQCSIDNENFNFIEACNSLRKDILENKSDGVDESFANKQKDSVKEVTLKDCQQNEKYRSDSSTAGKSNESIEHSDRSATESLNDADFLVEPLNNDEVDVKESENSFELEEVTCQFYLASSSHESFVWIWNTQTGASVDKLQMKDSAQTNFIKVCWINQTTIITNSRSGELILWTLNPIENDKIKFKRQKLEFNHRGVVGLCKLRSNDVIWTISTYRELTCEDISRNHIFAKYSCASTNIAQIREHPEDIYKIACACSDRRVALLDLSSLSPTNVVINNFSTKIHAAITSLAWSPDDSCLAFATIEGKIGVFDTEKLSKSPIVMNPFCGKAIYSLACNKSHLFACANNKLAMYELNGKKREPYIVPNIQNPTSIFINGNFFIVGTEGGNIEVYKQNIETFDFALISTQNVSSKYISEISFSSLKPTRMATCSNAKQIPILNMSETGVLTLEIVITHSDMEIGNACVKWSNQVEDRLLSCGYDGGVRIWDLGKLGEQLIYLKQFPCPMYCGIFSPLNDNVVICAGKLTSIELIDITKDSGLEYKKPSTKKNKNNWSDICWAKKSNKLPASTRKNRTQLQKLAKISASECELVDEKKINDLTNLMEKMDANSDKTDLKKKTHFVEVGSSILHLISKELGKDVLLSTIKLLEKNEHFVDINDDIKEDEMLLEKLFGTRNDVRDVLNQELRNHHKSSSNSVGCLIIPQLTGNLEEEIVNCIKSRKLTEWHVAVSPTISYDLWKNCSIAFADQLLESGYTLHAATFLLAVRNVQEVIEMLLAKKLFREAWVIGKLYKESDDDIMKNILDEWIEFMNVNGNLEGVALLCTLCGRYSQAHEAMLKRNRRSNEHEKLITLLNKKLNFK